MTTKPLTLKIGAHRLDLLNPDPGHIDLGAIDSAPLSYGRASTDDSQRTFYDIASTIQADTVQAVERMKKGTEDVQSGKDVVNKAGTAFETITSAVSSLTESSEAILAAAQRSAQKAEQLVSVMDGINKTGRDVAAETESVSAATEEQSASMDEIAGASQKLAELAQDLQGSTSKFKI